MHRYRCRYLITMTGATPEVITDGVLDVDGDHVVYAGPAVSDPRVEEMEVTELDGAVMPGFVNAHAHTPMVLLRGAGEGLPTDVWLNTVMWPREARLTADDVTWAMRLGAAELLAGGVTTTNEMYFYPDEMAAAAVEAGLRAIIGGPLIEAAAIAGSGGPLDEQLDAITRRRARWAGEPLIEIAVSPHSAYALSEPTLDTIGAYVAATRAADAQHGRRPMLVHTHLAEQPHEDDAVKQRSGLTAAAYLDACGLVTDRTIVAHAVWLTPADIELLAARGTSVAHCPCSNGRHASGIAPIAAMDDAGVKVGIGTDGPASHDRLDVFEELRSAVRYARLAAGDAGVAAGVVGTALRRATAGSADAIGRDDLGRLAPGAAADFIEVDVDALGFAPVLDPADLVGRIVWAGSPSAVRNVWVGGRQVVTAGTCTTVDITTATTEVTTRATRLAS